MCVYLWDSPDMTGGLYPDESGGHRCTGSGFNSTGFTRRLTGQPVRRDTEDLYGRDRGSATCGLVWNRCHTENGSELL